jgi:hypothetical protein
MTGKKATTLSRQSCFAASAPGEYFAPLRKGQLAPATYLVKIRAIAGSGETAAVYGDKIIWK